MGETDTLERSGDGDALTAGELAAANIHPQTRLATDYLNHFNEVVMLIDMLPMMPDCAPDVVDWMPRSYVDHFRLSSFKGRDLAIRAYGAVEPARLAAFEKTIRSIERSIADIQRLILEAPLEQLPVQDMADLAEMRVKPLLAHAMGLINGAPAVDAVVEESGDAQQAVDALFP